MTERGRWRGAACQDEELDAELWFRPHSPAARRKARAVCARCPLAEPCFEYALADPDLHGIWAGTTAKDRRLIREDREWEALFAEEEEDEWQIH